MRAQSLIQFLDAAVDTKHIAGPFDERGGIMIVAPPGSLKTTVIDNALSAHADTIICSDLNVHQWMKIKDEFISQRYTAMGFPEFEKLYQRHSSTAANLEGIIKALVSEGYGTGPGGDPRMPRILARGLVIGGITVDCFERKYNEWQKNGFLRRFLWIVTAVHNPNLIVEAIHDWKKISLGRVIVRPANGIIEVDMPREKSVYLEKMMKEQPGLHGTGLVLIKKICSVLQWKLQDENKVNEILEDISPALSKRGARLILE